MVSFIAGFLLGCVLFLAKLLFILPMVLKKHVALTSFVIVVSEFAIAGSLYYMIGVLKLYVPLLIFGFMVALTGSIGYLAAFQFGKYRDEK